MHYSAELKPRALPMAAACKYIGCGRTFMYELLRSGKVRAVKMGRKKMPLTDSLDQYIDTLAKEAA